MCRVTQCDLATMMRATLSLLVRRSPREPGPDMRLIDADRQGRAWSPLLTPWLEDVVGRRDRSARLPGKRAHIDLFMRIQNHVEGYDRGVLPPVIPALLAQPIVETCLRIRSEEHTSELQSLMRNSYAVFCLKKKKNKNNLP